MPTVDLAREHIGSDSEKGRAQAYTARVKDVIDILKTKIAAAQQLQKEQANKRRQAQERFNINDWVWVSHKNFADERPSKKLSWRQGWHRVTAVPGPNNIQIQVGDWQVMVNVDQIKCDPGDPWLSQVLADSQPPPVVDENGIAEEEYVVEKILAEEFKKRPGRGRRHKEWCVLVKWC
jgi:hypothetical protein